MVLNQGVYKKTGMFVVPAYPGITQSHFHIRALREHDGIGIFSSSFSRYLSSLRDGLRIFSAILYEPKLPNKQASLNGGGEKKRKSEGGNPPRIFHESFIKFGFGLTFVALIVGFGSVLANGYFAADKNRRFFTASLFCLGLLAPPAGVYFI